MIDLLPSEEQQSIADGVASFLQDAFPLERFRQARKGAGGERWDELAELGAFGLSIAEDAGGVGLGLVEDVLVFRELGRHMVSPAAIAVRLAASVAAEAGDAELVGALLSGARRAGLATRTTSGVQFLEAGEGDLIVLPTKDAVEVYGPEAATGATKVHCLDETLSLRRGQLSDQPMLSSTAPKTVLSAKLLAAAMLCGLLEVTRDMASEYAKTRKQFGQPIGVFQGVKHPIANMAVNAEAGWSHVAYTALMVDNDQPDAAFQVAGAKLLIGEDALRAGRDNVQIHGGMGFTDEVDAQLVLKRVEVLHQLFEDPRATPRTLVEMTVNL